MAKFWFDFVLSFSVVFSVGMLVILAIALVKALK